MDTAILAGQIMLECNAESYRVEETMNYILSTSNFETCEAFAMATRVAGSYFGKVGALEEGFEADMSVVDDRVLNDGIDDIKKRFERFLYLSDECSLLAKYVAGEQII